MDDDTVEQMAEKINPAWAGLVAAFGLAADSSMPRLRIAWSARQSDIADPSAVAAKLAEGCKKSWEIVAKIRAEPSFKGKGSKDRTYRRNFLAVEAAASLCKSAIIAVIDAGMFKAALDGFWEGWRYAPHGGRWETAETLALITRKASNLDGSLWPEPLSIESQMDLLIAFPSWLPSGNESQRDPVRIWTDALADLARASARRPELSDRCAALAKLSEPLWSTGVGSLEHFGRQLSSLLQFMRFPGGKLDSGYWSALPFEVRLGVVLGAKPQTQLGAWAINHAVSEALARDDGLGPARRELEDLCAGIWCGFDRRSIDLLDFLAPSSHEAWVDLGLARRFSSSGNNSSITSCHYAENSWQGAHAKWARKLAFSAGLAPEDDNGQGLSWEALVVGIQALRQAELINKSLPATSTARGKARVKASASRRL